MSTPVRVKKGSGYVNDGSSSGTVSLGSAPASGNLLVVVVGADKNSGGYTVSGFTSAVSLRGASTSLHILWKVSAGTETTVTATRSGGNSPSGDQLWYAEYSQTGAGAWGANASATSPYSDATTKSRSTGTTGATAFDGMAIAAWTVDNWNNVEPGMTYTRGTEQRGQTDNYGGVMFGAAGLYVATDPVGIGTTFQSTFKYTGTADQVAGGVVVFGRQTPTGGSVAAVRAPATGAALLPIIRGSVVRLYPTTGQSTAVAPTPVVDIYRPKDPTDLQAHICIDPDATVPIWRDMSPYLLITDAYEAKVTRGRTDELADLEAGTCSFNLDNSTGEFTPDRAASSYYPHCTTDTKVRLRFPDLKGNHVPAESASFEGGTVGGWLGFFGSATVAASTTRAVSGTYSLQVTWASSGPLAFCYGEGLVNGRTYTASVWVYVPAGQPAVTFNSFDWTGSATSTVTGAWQQLSVTFTLPHDHDRTDGVMFAVGWSGGSAGQSVWVDALMVNEGTYGAAFSTTLNHNDRFTGEVASWYEIWPGGSNECVAQVTAADRIADLGRHTFNSIAVEQTKLNDPLTIYPLDEEAEAATAADASGEGGPTATLGTRGSGGGDAANDVKAFVYGEDGPAGARTCATFYSGSGGTDHTYLRGIWDADPLGDTGYAGDRMILAAFKVKSTTQAGVILRLASSSDNGIEIGVDSTGKVYGIHSTGTTEKWRITSASDFDDDAWHTVMLAWNAATTTARLYVDDDQVGTTTWAAGTIGPANERVYIGGKPNGLGLRGSIAVAAVLGSLPADADISAMSAAILNGHENEPSNERAARYLAFAGVPAAEMVMDEGAEQNMANINIYGMSAWDALTAVNITEGGVTFARRDGAMQFHDRYAGYNEPAALVLDQLDIGKDTSLGVDSQLHANRSTATSEAAGSYTAENRTDIAKRGVYQRDLEIATTSYESLRSRAEWLVANNGGDPAPRFPAVPVDLTSQTHSIVTAAQALDLTSRIQVTGLHTTTAPAATITQRIEGYTEYISLNGWRMEFNTAPSADYDVLLLDDPTLGVLDGNNVLGY